MKTEEENEMASGSDVVFNPPLYIQRYQLVFDVLTQKCQNIHKIADFGCAEGKLFRRLKRMTNVEEIALIDCDDYSLEMCVHESRPLPYDFLFAERDVPLKVNVYKGSVAENDSRLKNFDAITCIELIEHLTVDVLQAFPDNIFGYIRPKVVIITTPNIEYNVLFPQLKNTSQLRHYDHKFEWTRHEFDNWCQSIVKNYQEYSYEKTGVGEPPEQYSDVGFCTQIAIFRRHSDTDSTDDITDKCLNYKIVDTFDYPKNTRIHKEMEFVDWPSVCN